MGIMGLRQTNHFKNDDGHALAEFAIVFPLYCIIIFGIFELTSIFTTRLFVGYSSFIASRTLMVHPDSGNTDATDASRLSLAATVDPALLVAAIGSLRIKTTSMIKDSYATVKVTYRKPISAPIIGRIIDPLGSIGGIPNINLTSETTLPVSK